MDSLCEPASQVLQESFGVNHRALAHSESGNELSVGIQGDEGPDITNALFPSLCLPLLLADESPDFINLDFRALNVAHLGILNLGARFASTNSQAHDRITVDTCNALDCADTAALCQHGNREDFLLGWKVVCHIVLYC